MNQERLKVTKQERYLPGPGIVNRYWLQGTLTTRTPLHIGTGVTARSWKDRDKVQDKAADNCNYVVLEQEGIGGGSSREEKTGMPLARPLIPGTSLRGVLRSFLESILFPFNTPGRLDVASLSSTEYDVDRGITQANLDDRRVTLRSEAPADPPDQRERHTERGVTSYLLEESDLVGFLFGTTHVRGRVAFGTAAAAGIKSKEEVRGCFTIHTGVSIDRDRGAAEDGKLFDIELVRPGVRFGVDIRMTNVRYWEIGMVLLALEAFNHREFPLHLGGLTQHGYGAMRWQAGEFFQLGSDARGAAPPLADWIAGTDSQGSPQARLAVGGRGIKGVKSAQDFSRHCIQAFQQVMDHVCA